MARTLLESLRQRGFDRSEYDRSQRNWRPRCSQCEVLVINGTACHEIGLPQPGQGPAREREERC